MKPSKKTAKPRRKASTTAETTVAVVNATIESVLDDSIATLALGIAAIRTEIEAIKSGTSTSDKHDAGSRIAFLTAKVGSIADSIRKVEAARSKRIEKLTRPQVLAWLRTTLDESERAAFLREASRIDEEESVLA